jgi:hypothetical protein
MKPVKKGCLASGVLFCHLHDCYRYLWIGLSLALFGALAFGSGKKTSSNEEGRFGIYVDGIEIGEERFSIQGSSNSYQSESVVVFKSPGPVRQDVRIETQLAMDENYMPKSYRVKKSIAGKSVDIEGAFVEGEATFKYEANGTPHQTGLLLDDYYIVLDANVFHHFIFVGRLVEFGNSVQSLDVVVPQEMDNGVLEIRDTGLEKIEMHGKKKELHHLKVDSGKLKIDLWVDDYRVLHRIALPGKNIEVLRKS